MRNTQCVHKEMIRSFPWNKIIGSILILSLATKILFLLTLEVFHPQLNTYGYTEFLINFEGGFVRRGLIGQLLFWICRATRLSPALIISVICITAYAAVLCFFIRQFRLKGYCWWFILSPLLCGYTAYLIRKDYILYLILIGCITLLQNNNSSLFKRYTAVLLAIFGLFIHEAFIFWGIPTILILLWTDKKYWISNTVSTLLILACTATLFLFKGNEEIANTIRSSWNSILSGQPIMNIDNNSIGALSWDTYQTFKAHLNANFTRFGWGTLFIRPITWVIIYYFLINFLFVFADDMSPKQKKQNQLHLSSLYLLTTICLLPMFTILSCDWGRIYQYAIFPALTAFLLIPANRLASAIPSIFKRMADQLNRMLTRIVKPNKRLMVILLLFSGISSPISFTIFSGFAQSPLGYIFSRLYLIFFLGI